MSRSLNVAYIDFDGDIARITCERIREHSFLEGYVALHGIEGINESTLPRFKAETLVIPQKKIAHILVGIEKTKEELLAEARTEVLQDHHIPQADSKKPVF